MWTISLDNHNRYVHSSCLTHDGNFLVTGSRQDIRIMNLKTQTSSEIKEIHDSKLLWNN